MLLTTPLTLNDGSADHIYESQGQIANAKSLHQRYFEPLAPSAEPAQINAKSDLTSATLEKKLIQFTQKRADVDGVVKPITVNITLTYAKSHDINDVVKLFTRARNAITTATATKLCQGYV